MSATCISTAMKLKLKEQPREWWKFTAVMAVFPALLAWSLHRKQHLSATALAATLAALVGVLGVCALRPRWFRGFYRAGMTASFHIGQCIGRVMLTLFFLVVLTPLGMLLRILGKDLLAMRRRKVESYWRPARPWGPLHRQF
jgi:hypothetical protein